MWKHLRVLYYYINIFMLITPATSEVLVDTAQGRLRGIALDTHSSFLSVPYAIVDSPINKFRRGSAAPSWKGVRDARFEDDPCPSGGGHDTCLRLHVHVPRAAAARPWPVLVWLAAGAGVYYPANLVRREIIVVKLDYRTGPRGFLCSDKEAAPGNAGAKDVVLGLRWVRDNIVAFSGDPSKVTVAGQGFGAAIADALTLSSMAQGLFHGVIIQSGSVLCPWAFNYNANTRAQTFIDTFSPFPEMKNSSNFSKLFQTDTEALTQKAKLLNFSYFAFGMCAEKAFKKEERFLREPSIVTLKGRRISGVPLLIGYNSDEAYILLDILERLKVARRVHSDMNFLLPEELVFHDRKKITETVNKIKALYFKDNITIRDLMDYYRDAYFASHIVRSARLHAEADVPVYLYRLEHRGLGGVDARASVPKRGAAHSDELHYLFPEPGRVFHGEDRIVQERLTTLWTDFVCHLKPTSALSELNGWGVLDTRKPRVYALGAETHTRDLANGRALRFWDDIYEKHLYLQHDRDVGNFSHG